MTEKLQLRDEADESLTNEELPEQMGPQTPTILPGISHFRIPPNIDQCWEAKDYERKDKDGNTIIDPATQKPAVEQHLLLKMDKENPMVVVGGEFDGLPATATITTIPRKRGKKNDPNAPMVHDLSYFVRESLADKSVVARKSDWLPIVNKHAGEVVRLEHGLSANCDPERVRYIPDGAGGVIQDPDGNHGCGKAGGSEKKTRLYTADFKVTLFQCDLTGESYNTRDEALAAATERGGGAANVKSVPAWTDQVQCKNPECGAMLRGFFRIERFLAPLASTQQAGS